MTMQSSKFEIGDVVPMDGRRKPFGELCSAAWFIVICGRQRREMVAAAAWLGANGAEECWFPEDVVRKNVRRGKRVFREQVRIPIVPGVIFMLTESAPNWDVIEDLKRYRPLRLGERAVVVREEEMAAMEEVPDRVAQLREAVIEAERQKWEASMPRAGEPAIFTDGPLKGMCAHVERIAGSEVIVLVGGAKVRSTITSLQRNS